MADQDTYFPYVAFNAKLALKMGWFTQNQAGGYEVGPNLIMSYVDGLVPASNLPVRPHFITGLRWIAVIHPMSLGFG